MESDFTQFGNARRIRFLFWFRGFRTLCAKILRKKRAIKERKILFGKGGHPSASILKKLRNCKINRTTPHENRKKIRNLLILCNFESNFVFSENVRETNGKRILWTFALDRSFL